MPGSPESVSPRVLIVAEHATAAYGGEAVLPWHYFRLLRARGVEAWLVVHARNRDELLAAFPHDLERIHFVPDTKLDRLLFRIYQRLPAAVGNFTVLWLQRTRSQFLARRIARRLVREQRIDVVHQPIPVSPKETSVLHGMGAPVVMGPMNGGMHHPPGFEHSQGVMFRASVRAARWLSDWMHRALPGKRLAETLVVSNDRTRDALPPGCRGRVAPLVENGVDLSVWSPPRDARLPRQGELVRFVFSGRLVDWKGVHYLLDAFAGVRASVAATLEIIGDGPRRAALEAQAVKLGIDQFVTFRGWLPQPECAAALRDADVFVLPSLYESGGAVVLEAMACGLPVIATRWGGPADYLDASCGVLVEPRGRETFATDLAAAMQKLAGSPDLRQRMGQAGREKVVREYDWERKIDRMLTIYRETARRARLAQEGSASKDRLFQPARAESPAR
jgi:glycosyltransferase involved in cell wall biosynthesis